MHTHVCFYSFSFDLYSKYFQPNMQCFEKQNNYFKRGENKDLEIKLLKACEKITFFVVSICSEYFWEVLITNFWAKVIKRCAFVEEIDLQYKQLFKNAFWAYWPPVDLLYTMKQSLDPLLFSKIDFLIVGQDKNH